MAEMHVSVSMADTHVSFSHAQPNSVFDPEGVVLSAEGETLGMRAHPPHAPTPTGSFIASGPSGPALPAQGRITARNRDIHICAKRMLPWKRAARAGHLCVSPFISCGSVTGIKDV
jgi:hypothetical protein